MFRTVYPHKKEGFSITHSNNIILLGSCFTQNIGAKLNELKFNTLKNPFGISYNPVSIFKSLNIILKQKDYSENDLIFFNEKHHSFEHHSDYSDTDSQQCLNTINQSIKNSFSYLKTAEYCFISLGSAYVHKYIKDNKIVANCHKIPNSEFEKKLLTVSQIVDSFELMHQKLTQINPTLKFIFTVSPIRHIKDGFHENQLSKSTLLLAIDELKKKHKSVFYFPSYEIMMDDLRDYRFYKNDMLHPTSVAVNYIWNYFRESYFTTETNNLIEKIEKINLSLKHKSFNPESDAHKKFVEKLNSDIKKLGETNPNIKFD